MGGVAVGDGSVSESKPPESERETSESLPPEALESIPPPNPLTDDPDEVDEQLLDRARAMELRDYFALLHLRRPRTVDDLPDDDQVRAAFRSFALECHPDRFEGADDEVRAHATMLFARGAEAYRVLLDPLLRRSYARTLLSDHTLRIDSDELAQSMRAETTRPSQRIADLVRSKAAEAFAKRADELLDQGHMKQALLQLRLAVSKDSGNPRLEERLRELEGDLAKKPR